MTPEEALGYAMSLPVAVTISGMDTLEVLHQNLAVARGFQPLVCRPARIARALPRRAADGHIELFKMTMKYDGDVGREQHGYPKEQEMPL